MNGKIKNILEWKKTKHPLLKEYALMEIVSGNSITMCRYKIKEKVKLSAHSHPHEQIAYVIKGRMKMRIGEIENILGPGDVKIIPGNMEHSAEILETPFEEIDVFNPVREDFIN
ncbi:MAG: cupin domain-containing protein [Spirochaetales bacterium]|nr:cupin domain-containing protein [Spirochaetales bacterium]